VTDAPVTPVWETAGFEYEQPDPSVGIFGGWAHWCNADRVTESDPSIEISEGWAFDHFEGEGANRSAVGDKSLVCNTCGATVTWRMKDWDPQYEDNPDYEAPGE
jgi:hypothetical protein